MTGPMTAGCSCRPARGQSDICLSGEVWHYLKQMCLSFRPHDLAGSADVSEGNWREVELVSARQSSVSSLLRCVATVGTVAVTVLHIGSVWSARKRPREYGSTPVSNGPSRSCPSIHLSNSVFNANDTES